MRRVTISPLRLAVLPLLATALHGAPASAFSSGATICDVTAGFDNVQFHGGLSQQAGPFTIEVSSTTYRVGTPVEVTVTTSGAPWRGLVLAAYRAGTATRVGSFATLPPELEPTNGCGPSSITHTTSAPKTSATVTWTASADEGSVVFAAYVATSGQEMFRIVEDDLSAPIIAFESASGEGEGEGEPAGEGEGEPVGEGEGEPAGEGEGEPAGEGEGEPAGEGEGEPAGEGEGEPAGEGEGEPAGEGEGETGGGPAASSGCGCSSGRDAAPALLMLALLGVRRRRRS